MSHVLGPGLQVDLHLVCMPGIGRLGKGRAAQCSMVSFLLLASHDDHDACLVRSVTSCLHAEDS